MSSREIAPILVAKTATKYGFCLFLTLFFAFALLLKDWIAFKVSIPFTDLFNRNFDKLS